MSGKFFWLPEVINDDRERVKALVRLDAIDCVVDNGMSSTWEKNGKEKLKETFVILRNGKVLHTSLADTEVQELMASQAEELELGEKPNDFGRVQDLSNKYLMSLKQDREQQKAVFREMLPEFRNFTPEEMAYFCQQMCCNCENVNQASMILTVFTNRLVRD